MVNGGNMVIWEEAVKKIAVKGGACYATTTTKLQYINLVLLLFISRYRRNTPTILHKLTFLTLDRISIGSNKNRENQTNTCNSSDSIEGSAVTREELCAYGCERVPAVGCNVGYGGSDGCSKLLGDNVD